MFELSLLLLIQPPSHTVCHSSVRHANHLYWMQMTDMRCNAQKLQQSGEKVEALDTKNKLDGVI